MNIKNIYETEFSYFKIEDVNGFHFLNGNTNS